MPRNLLFVCLLSLVLSACTTNVTPTAVRVSGAEGNFDERFRRHCEQVLEEMWQEFPESGVRYGYYKYADQMTVPDQARRERSLAFFDRQLSALAKFDPATLSDTNKVDLSLMRNHFESKRWYLTTFKAWQWQPSHYNVGDGFGLMLTTPYAPLDTRLRQVMSRLEKVPAYYDAAKASIVDPTLEHTQLALIQNKGALGIFGEDLVQKVDASSLTVEEKARFKARLQAARSATSDYIAFLSSLETKLKSGPARSFRIGKDLYAQKFVYDIQSGFTAEQLYRRALADKAMLHGMMEQRARELWPKYMGNAAMPADRLELIRAVIDELSKRHTTREAFVDTIRKHIPALEAFVREKDLLDQDPTRPLVVREMPMHMRGGGAVASVSAPGPFDPQANTYYNATPLDAFTDEQAESLLREYNDWSLQLLNIHEGVPGHYTQLLHANKSKSRIKSIFGNGSMIEGWAVFGEKVMLDAGYGGNTPEIWLLWMKWNLRAVLNTVLDYEIQTAGLTRDAAITMMTREAFQQQTEATEKWRRATFTQVQLTSYFNGYAEITALRDEERARLGKDFSVKAFNNKFLSYGSAPVRDIRKLMQAGQ
ncbi:MAG: DUF885 domain-containing protein [Usitatibacteraceae bacterium]